MKRTGLRRKPGAKGLARGDGLKRTDGFKKPDPEAVREQLRKQREKAQARARATPARTPRPRVEFRMSEPVRGLACERCGAPAVARHHWVEQEQLRVFVRGLRLPKPEHDARLRAVLHDSRNLTSLCHRCHGIGGTDACPLTRADVPASAFTFAAELGDEWLVRLERTYPA
jgi:hypothetical protein